MNAVELRLYTHAACLLHEAGAGHPERPARLSAVLDALAARFPGLPAHESPRASREALLRVHAPELVATVLDTAPGPDLHWLDPDTMVPLVDTRLHAVVRRGRSGITTEWDGGLLIAE